MDQTNNIQTADNFFNKRDQNTVISYCNSCSYTYGEVDNQNTPPTGMVHNISESEKIYSLFESKLSAVPFIKGMELYRMYVNCFAPSENPYFHTDGEDGYTLLYYPQKDWKLDDGGETQFIIDNNLYGILPEPNRMIMFEANIPHRATTFRDRYRFTVAIKYK
tara:strand:- start:274 stop:762 length:489 start_codon:yes stop_codon:yes gene_type:complete